MKNLITVFSLLALLVFGQAAQAFDLKASAQKAEAAVKGAAVRVLNTGKAVVTDVKNVVMSPFKAKAPAK